MGKPELNNNSSQFCNEQLCITKVHTRVSIPAGSRIFLCKYAPHTKVEVCMTFKKLFGRSGRSLIMPPSPLLLSSYPLPILLLANMYRKVSKHTLQWDFVRFGNPWPNPTQCEARTQLSIIHKYKETVFYIWYKSGSTYFEWFVNHDWWHFVSDIVICATKFNRR